MKVLAEPARFCRSFSKLSYMNRLSNTLEITPSSGPQLSQDILDMINLYCKCRSYMSSYHLFLCEEDTVVQGTVIKDHFLFVSVILSQTSFVISLEYVFPFLYFYRKSSKLFWPCRQESWGSVMSDVSFSAGQTRWRWRRKTLLTSQISGKAYVVHSVYNRERILISI